MSKPRKKDIKSQIKQLRYFIENNKTSLSTRIAQIVEQSLRWCIEDTDWDHDKIKDIVEPYTTIISNDIKQ